MMYTPPGKAPFIPPDQQPRACAEHECQVRLHRAHLDAPPKVLLDAPREVVYLVHLRGPERTEVAAFEVPIAWLDDVDFDVWGRVRPWMESLHDAG